MYWGLRVSGARPLRLAPGPIRQSRIRISSIHRARVRLTFFTPRKMEPRLAVSMATHTLFWSGIARINLWNLWPVKLEFASSMLTFVLVLKHCRAVPAPEGLKFRCGVCRAGTVGRITRTQVSYSKPLTHSPLEWPAECAAPRSPIPHHPWRYQDTIRVTPRELAKHYLLRELL